MGKRPLLLALGAVLSIGLVVYQSFFQGSDMAVQPSSPIETPLVVPGQMQAELKQTQFDQNTSQLGSVQTADLGSDESLIDSIDTYFCSVAGKSRKENAALPNTGPSTVQGGAIVKLPELKNPNQLIPLKAPPPQLQGFGAMPIMPPAVVQQHMNLAIGGIFCSKGECKASSSIGVLSKGDSIGGQTTILEKVEAITMSGIKTDKRFIAY